MNIVLDEKYLVESDKYELEKLLLKTQENTKTDLEQLWCLIDMVWDEYQCDNRNPDSNKMALFYSHPIWLLNGFFSEQEPVSLSQREAISDWIAKNDFKSIVDYGGGFGTLARLIAKKRTDANVFIFEPFPSEFGLARSLEHQNIRMVGKLDDTYDCIVCMDVLEHVSDPLNDFSVMVQHVKIGGFLLVQNAFYPVIKCHLPQNFHFRHSFNLFARMMGLEVIGTVPGSCATILRKAMNKDISWRKIRFYEKVSRNVFHVMEFAKPVLKPIRMMLNQK